MAVEALHLAEPTNHKMRQRRRTGRRLNMRVAPRAQDMKAVEVMGYAMSITQSLQSAMVGGAVDTARVSG